MSQDLSTDGSKTRRSGKTGAMQREGGAGRGKKQQTAIKMEKELKEGGGGSEEGEAVGILAKAVL